MTDIEQRILDALRDLNATVARMATANPKPSLLPIFRRLDELERQLPSGAAPDLRHYLVKKSYEKALQHLEGVAAEIPRGSCPH